MDMSSLSNATVLAACNAMFAREAATRAPYLAAFRASAEEIEMKAEEAKVFARQLQDLPKTVQISVDLLAFAEGLAQQGRETVRFERWLDTHVRPFTNATI